MFNKCHKLREIKGINNFNTNKVTNMRGMFRECNELLYLDLSNFNTNNVTDMGFMFKKCHMLKEIKGIKNFNINIKDISGIFDECNELEYLIIVSKPKDKNNNYISNSYINKLDEENKQLKKEMENMFAISFTTIDQQINYLMVCKNSDNFKDLEEKLYLEYPQLRKKDIYFMANGNIINRNETLENNGIKNNTAILINENEN